MVTLVCGAKQVYASFGRECFVPEPVSGTDDLQQITIDIPRSRFLGSLEQREQHIQTWLNPEQTPCGYYTQGNMDARNLAPTLLGDLPFFNPVDDQGLPIDQNDPSPARQRLLNTQFEAYFSQFKKYEYAYISNQGELCGVSLQFCADDPGKWIFSLIKKTNRPPQEREIYVVFSEQNSNFPTFKDEEQPSCAIHRGDDALDLFRGFIDSDLITCFFDMAMFKPEQGVDPRCSIFEQIAHAANEATPLDNSNLINIVLNQNGAASSAGSAVTVGLETMRQSHALLTKLGIAGATPQQIEQVLKRDGWLYEQIQSKPDVVQAYLTLAVKLDRWGIGDLRIDLLNKDGFAPAFAKLYADSNYRDMLEKCLRVKFYKDEELHQLFTLMANNTQEYGMARCLKQLYETGIGFANLMSIVNNPDTHELVRFLTPLGFTGAEFSTWTISPECIAVMREIEGYLNEHPAGSDAPIKKAAQELMSFFNGEIVLLDLLGRLSDTTEVPQHLSTKICRIIRRRHVAQELSANPVALLAENNAWLDAAILILDQKTECRNTYVDVFAFANLASAPLSLDGLENALQALHICRRSGVTAVSMPLDRLLRFPLLCGRVNKRSLDINRLTSLSCIAEDQLDKKLVAWNHLDRIYEDSGVIGSRSATDLVMGDNDLSHIFRCMLRLIQTPDELDGLYSTITSGYVSSALSDALKDRLGFCENLRALHVENQNNAIELLTSDTPEGEKFYRALCVIENKSREINDHLNRPPFSIKYDVYRSRVNAFRKNIYELAYQELTNPDPATLAVRIRASVGTLSETLNEDRSPFLRQCLKALVNALTVIFTFGYLNKRHQEKTGDFCFFSRPRSSQMLREALVELPTIIGAPAA